MKAKAFAAIPPGSRIKLIRSDKSTPLWKNKVGAEFAVGYYSKVDGLDVIWLVDQNGMDTESIDHQGLKDYFEVLYLAPRKNYYGPSKTMRTSGTSRASNS